MSRVTTVAGSRLSAATLAAVRAFVAAAIPGLRPERVTVVDDRGETGEEAEGAIPQRERALQTALDAAFGADATIVRVHLERDERARESREMHRLPHGIPIARTVLDERLSGEKKSYVKTESSEDRGSDEREERVRIGPGAVARVSVAVIVDARRGLDLAKIREVAAAAAGIDRARGDTLSVEAVPFDRPRQPSGARYVAGTLAELAPTFALAIVALAALRTAARPIAMLAAKAGRRVRLERTVRSAPGASPGVVFEALRGEPPHAAAAVLASLDTPLATAVLERYPRMRARRSSLASRCAVRPSPTASSGSCTMAEFKSFATIFRERARAAEPAPISPLIAEPPVPPPALAARERLFPALLAERLDCAVQTLLREIAAEVVGRELLLAPVEIERIVARLRERYRLDDDCSVRASAGGDVAFAWSEGEIDASLGRRVAAAIDRAAL